MNEQLLGFSLLTNLLHITAAHFVAETLSCIQPNMKLKFTV